MKLLYITGTDRSGTTMVSRLISSFLDCAVVGETARFFWERGVEHNELCSCGRRFNKCSFWSTVAERMKNDFKQPVDSGAMTYYRRIIDLNSRWPRWIHKRQTTQARHCIDESEARRVYGKCMAELFDVIGEVSGRGVIVDSSKSAIYATMLEQNSEAEVFVLHLVRDSRAVAFSHSRKKKTNGSLSSSKFMRRLNATSAARFWTRTNMESLLLRRSMRNRYLRVKYEDIVSNPGAFGNTLRRFLSEEQAHSCIDSSDRSTVHVFSGNPMRVQREINIKPDVEWITGMKRKDRLIVTCLTLPLLLQFKYPIIPRNQRNVRPDVS